MEAAPAPIPAPTAVTVLSQQLRVLHNLDQRLDTANAQLDQVLVNQNQINRVVVVDIRMNFGSMVTFMVKWALAAIPAVIILFVIGFVLFSCMTTFLTSALLR